jgi:hypothetical protein
MNDSAMTVAYHPTPWNKGKLIGQKPPLKLGPSTKAVTQAAATSNRNLIESGHPYTENRVQWSLPPAGRKKVRASRVSRRGSEHAGAGG